MSVCLFGTLRCFVELHVPVFCARFDGRPFGVLAESTDGRSAGAAGGEGEACQPPARGQRGLGLVPLPCWQQGQPRSVSLPPDLLSGLPLLRIYGSGWGSFGAVSAQQGAIPVGPQPAGVWPPCTRPALQHSSPQQTLNAMRLCSTPCASVVFKNDR